MIMTRIFSSILLVACVFAAADASFAQPTINLAWDDCGSAGISTKDFACDANTGDPFTLVASFQPPSDVNQFLGVSAVIQIDGDELPDWWRHGLASCRGGTEIFPSFDGWGTTCTDFWAGRAGGGLTYEIGWSGPTNARLRIQAGVADADNGPIDSNLEYYAFKVRVSRSNSSGSGACAGCQNRMQISLDEIQLFQLPEAGFDPVITLPKTSTVVSWQAPTAPPPPTPVVEGSTVYPNPFRDQATLTWSLTRAGRVKVAIFDITGRQMSAPVDVPDAQPGTHFLPLQNRNDSGGKLAAGVYFYRIESGDGVREGSFVVLE
jgi:Secretion system C-terminal sorting domain